MPLAIYAYNTNTEPLKWTLKHYSGSTFNVVPKKDGALQVALDGPVITVLPAGSYTFSFKDVGDGYKYENATSYYISDTYVQNSIQTGSMTANWGLERAIAGADVRTLAYASA